MNEAAIKWAMSQRERMTTRDKVVLVTLAHHSDSNWRVEMSLKDLVEETGIGRRTLIRCTRRLEGAGFLQRRSTFAGPYIYELLGVPQPPIERPEPNAIVSRRWSREGFVYLMRNHRNGFTKIGFSVNPKYRERTLQSEEPEVELLWARKGTMLDEKALHDAFAEKRLRGEWFDLSDEECASIIQGEGTAENCPYADRQKEVL